MFKFDITSLFLVKVVKEVRMTLLTKLFTVEQMFLFRNLMDAGVTIDQICDILLKFGTIIASNRDNALICVQAELCKGKKRKKSINVVYFIAY